MHCLHAIWCKEETSRSMMAMACHRVFEPNTTGHFGASNGSCTHRAKQSHNLWRWLWKMCQNESLSSWIIVKCLLGMKKKSSIESLYQDQWWVNWFWESCNQKINTSNCFMCNKAHIDCGIGCGYVLDAGVHFRQLECQIVVLHLMREHGEQGKKSKYCDTHILVYAIRQIDEMAWLLNF